MFSVEASTVFESPVADEHYPLGIWFITACTGNDAAVNVDALQSLTQPCEYLMDSIGLGFGAAG